MQTKITWALVGAGVALVVVFGTMAGFLLAGHLTPTPGPAAHVVPTPSPGIYASRFRELPIPKPGGSPYAIIVGPDGAVWFTESECTSGIGRRDTSGAWQHWPITGNCQSQPLAITQGSDGNVWFADAWGAYGRVTPAGQITRFRMPGPSYPTGITTGPDGNLWLAAGSPQGKPFIAKIGLDGIEVAEYQLASSAGQPRGIVSGPDGAVWFTESAGIGRVTTNGQLNEFSLPEGNGSGTPYQLTVGPDKNIWFVEYMPQGDGRIGRLTPSGNLTEFATPGLGALQWITAGPDKALWFTAANSNSIGRISLTGVVTSYPLPELRAQPVGIMTGPDGNIWFTESPGDGSGMIGVFTVKP
jgi:streptogramin lyase